MHNSILLARSRALAVYVTDERDKEIAVVNQGAPSIYGLPEGTLGISREDWRARCIRTISRSWTPTARQRVLADGPKESSSLKFRVIRATAEAIIERKDGTRILMPLTRRRCGMIQAR